MRRILISVACSIFIAGVARAQGIISTIAGGGFVDNVPATLARLDVLNGLVVDASGNVYVSSGYRIRVIDAGTGVISTVAGTGQYGNFIEGTARKVNIYPGELAFGRAGNLFFLDESAGLGNLDLGSKIISLIVRASFNLPLLNAFAVDGAGNIYLSQGLGRILRIDAVTGAVITFAGNGLAGSSGDGGPAIAAALQPGSMALDRGGNLYVGDAHRIRKVSAVTGIITAYAGTGMEGFSGDGGPALQADLTGPGQLVMDQSDNLYFIDGGRVRRVDANTGAISTVAGKGLQQTLPLDPATIRDGIPATEATLLPTAIALDAEGNLYIGDKNGTNRVRAVSAATGIINTIAGTGVNGDGGLATGLGFIDAAGVAVNNQGDLFFSAGGSIRRVDHETNRVSTVAAGVSAASLAFDTSGGLLFSQPAQVRRVDLVTGSLTVVVGTGVAGFSGDGGPAQSAQLNGAAGIAVDANGNLFIADASSGRVRRVDGSTGIIATMAGNGNPSYVGEGGPATQASIGLPTDVAVDAVGNVYIASVSHVLKVSPDGMITAAGGNGKCGHTGDGGPAILAPICRAKSYHQPVR